MFEIELNDVDSLELLEVSKKLEEYIEYIEKEIKTTEESLDDSK